MNCLTVWLIVYFSKRVFYQLLPERKYCNIFYSYDLILIFRYGRRLPFLAAVFLQIVAGVTTAYSINWYMFTCMRFFLAVATGGTMVTSFVLTMELVGTNYRHTIGILYQIPFNLGHLSLPLFAYYLRDWYKMQLAISLPSLVFLGYYFVLPESPRWLLTANRTDEAIKIMKVAAKWYVTVSANTLNIIEYLVAYLLDYVSIIKRYKIRRLKFHVLFSSENLISTMESNKNMR